MKDLDSVCEDFIDVFDFFFNFFYLLLNIVKNKFWILYLVFIWIVYICSICFLASKIIRFRLVVVTFRLLDLNNIVSGLLCFIELLFVVLLSNSISINLCFKSFDFVFCLYMRSILRSFVLIILNVNNFFCNAIRWAKFL